MPRVFVLWWGCLGRWRRAEKTSRCRPSGIVRQLYAKSLLHFIYLFIWGFKVAFQHCTGHITMGGSVGGRKPVHTVGVSRFLYCIYLLGVLTSLFNTVQVISRRVVFMGRRKPVHTVGVSRFLYCIYLVFYVAFNTLYRSYHDGRFCGAEETSAYSWCIKGSLYFKLLTNGKQLPAFPLEVGPGFETPASEVGGEGVPTTPP